MQRTQFWLLSTAAILTLAGAQAVAAPLSGQVTSAKEGAMEGVLVTAHKEGSPVSVTVVSDATGRYSFPADRLEPGHYDFRIRAVGYVIEGARDVMLGANGATFNLKL